MKIFNIENDNVINGLCGLGETNYSYTLDKISKLINKLEDQRKLLDSKFYQRLERDILKGCIMPPLTLAFVSDKTKISSIEDLDNFVNTNIHKGFILDGIQRLNTLIRASKEPNFDLNRKIYFNIIIAENKDKLLYRMITLNNGQKGMTPRHQIEILTRELFDFSGFNIVVQTEKEKDKNPIKSSFSLGDIAKGYTAFLTLNVNNENSKIIEEKMDEILVGRILDNELNYNEVQFYDVLKLIDKFSDNEFCINWFRTVNNLIGFCVGVIKSYDFISQIESSAILEEYLKKFEESFKILNTSKINIGKFRRELAKYFIENIAQLSELSNDELDENFFETITSE